MKPKDLIGKHIQLEGQYEGRGYAVEGTLKKVTKDHLIIQETDKKGLTYWNRAITIIIVGVVK